jgi:hypothetical protein
VGREDRRRQDRQREEAGERIISIERTIQKSIHKHTCMHTCSIATGISRGLNTSSRLVSFPRTCEELPSLVPLPPAAALLLLPPRDPFETTAVLIFDCPYTHTRTHTHTQVHKHKHTGNGDRDRAIGSKWDFFGSSCSCLLLPHELEFLYIEFIRKRTFLPSSFEVRLAQFKS